MDSTATISLLAFGLSFATFIVLRLNRREEIADEIADEIAYGDCPRVPPELRPALRIAEGGSPSISGRADTHKVIAHDGTGL